MRSQLGALRLAQFVSRRHAPREAPSGEWGCGLGKDPRQAFRTAGERLGLVLTVRRYVSDTAARPGGR
jgi:hypothetical protein